MIAFEHFVSCPGHFLLSFQLRTGNVIFHYIKYLNYKSLSWSRPSPMVTTLHRSPWLRCSSTPPGYDAPPILLVTMFRHTSWLQCSATPPGYNAPPLLLVTMLLQSSWSRCSTTPPSHDAPPPLLVTMLRHPSWLRCSEIVKE